MYDMHCRARKAVGLSGHYRKMSSNKNQEVIFDYQKHEIDKEKRTKKKGLKGKMKNEASEEMMVSKKKTPSKKKSKYINYKNIDIDIFADEFDSNDFDY